MVIPKLNKFVSQFLSSLPAGLDPVKSEFEAKLRQGITQALLKMDLVTRQEFDVQTQVLARTRQRLQSLEEKLRQLEVVIALDTSKEELN